MNYLHDFDSYNESVKKFLTGAMLGASLLGSPSDVKAKEAEPSSMIGRNKKIKAELSVINEAEYTRIINDLEKKGYLIYGDKPSFDSKKFLFVSSSGIRRDQVLKQALYTTEEKINELPEDKGMQIIYYIHLQNTWEFVVITELVSEEREGMLYDRDTRTWRVAKNDIQSQDEE